MQDLGKLSLDELQHLLKHAPDLKVIIGVKAELNRRDELRRVHKGEGRWTRGEKLVGVTLIVTLLTLIAAFVVPEVRDLVGLQPTPPLHQTIKVPPIKKTGPAGPKVNEEPPRPDQRRATMFAQRVEKSNSPVLHTPKSGAAPTGIPGLWAEFASGKLLAYYEFSSNGKIRRESAEMRIPITVGTWSRKGNEIEISLSKDAHIMSEMADTPPGASRASLGIPSGLLIGHGSTFSGAIAENTIQGTVAWNERTISWKLERVLDH